MLPSFRLVRLQILNQWRVAPDRLVREARSVHNENEEEQARRDRMKHDRMKGGALRQLKAGFQFRDAEPARNTCLIRELVGAGQFLDCPNQRCLEATMIKQLMISAAVSALMVSGAMAQAEPPKAMPKTEAMPAGSGKFVSSQSADQWVFSKFKGSDVLGPDNAQVGDVNDLLFDKNGKIIAVIVGVGGFLGIGEKNVAIDMSAFQVVPASTGTTGAAGSDNDPTNVKLKTSWTKDQLKNAPEFAYYKAPARTTDRPATSPTTGMAPRERPAAPPATPPASQR